MTSDMAALRTAIDATSHPALFVVDVVASLGATAFEMDAWRCDVVLGASQKDLMCPPGIGFAAANARGMAACERKPGAALLLGLAGCAASDLGYRKFCGTPPQTLLAGMEAALETVLRRIPEQVFRRHRHGRRRACGHRLLEHGGGRAAILLHRPGGALGLGDGHRSPAGHRARRCATWRARASRSRWPVAWAR